MVFGMDRSSQIKDDMDGGDKITIFDCIKVILHGNDPKLPPFLELVFNAVTRYLFLRLEIQDHH